MWLKYSRYSLPYLTLRYLITFPPLCLFKSNPFPSVPGLCYPCVQARSCFSSLLDAPEWRCPVFWLLRCLCLLPACFVCPILPDLLCTTCCFTLIKELVSWIFDALVASLPIYFSNSVQITKLALWQEKHKVATPTMQKSWRLLSEQAELP